jgi:hypothetical protein
MRRQPPPPEVADAALQCSQCAGLHRRAATSETAVGEAENCQKTQTQRSTRTPHTLRADVKGSGAVGLRAGQTGEHVMIKRMHPTPTRSPRTLTTTTLTLLCVHRHINDGFQFFTIQ